MIARIVFAHVAGVVLLAAAAPAANSAPATAVAKRPAAAPVKKTTAAVEPPLAEVTALAQLQSQPAYRRYVHPDAKAMAGIDLTRIAASPLGKKLAAQIGGMGMKEKAAAEGLEFVSDIDKLVLSSPGEISAKGGPATLSEEAPFVVAMQGKFKIDKIRKSLIARKATRLMHGNAEVWLPAKGDTSLAIVNSQLMLLGDRKSLRATLEAAAETASEGAASNDEDTEEPVRKRAGELAKMYDFWLVSDASLEGLSAAAPKVPQAEMLNGIDQIEVGISFKHGLAADVSLHGRTPEETAKLGTMLAGVKALASLAMQQKNQPELTGMLEKLKLGTSGERVMLSVKFSQQELDRGFSSYTSSGGNLTAKSTGSTRPTITNEPPVRRPSPPPPALVVRIFNAEGGTREVPLSR